MNRGEQKDVEQPALQAKFHVLRHSGKCNGGTCEAAIDVRMSYEHNTYVIHVTPFCDFSVHPQSFGIASGSALKYPVAIFAMLEL